MSMTDYFDCQVNGHLGVDFNSDETTLEQVEKVCHQTAAWGMTGFLPTLITDQVDSMANRLSKLVEIRSKSAAMAAMIPGFHIEGPFISSVKGFVGAHPVQHARQASMDDAKRLIDAGQGLVKLLTLAPECDPDGNVTRWLVKQSIRVAAGHTDASLDQLRSAIDSGLTGFTHLGNGCPLEMHRHDNIIQRVLHFRDTLWVSLIADGAHLPSWVLKNFIDILGFQRTLVVTDAISAAGLGPGRYKLGAREVLIGEDGVPRSEDNTHFIGSGATMPVCDMQLQRIGLSDVERHALLSANPRSFLGLHA